MGAENATTRELYSRLGDTEQKRRMTADKVFRLLRRPDLVGETVMRGSPKRPA
ncbi:hypothetical protein PB2503_10194 [Parvularcula bermudensis HTCC2503]|uniref:Uncharacterized protein n=1 Tax=Parvularcula bermudensis (strain ATCC BAA-594 / HTCC2503 / KCTC 12087) TaxID=314260 RepID=E0TFG6_PARBH|nr:hypothetical protein [Parvularcula bermudensis]ADM10090.1 hypothetical protein PB2503_10194 [Parvularcula bermudensis HTCC2503]